MPGGGQRGAVRTEDRFVGGKPGHRSRSLGRVNRLPERRPARVLPQHPLRAAVAMFAFLGLLYGIELYDASTPVNLDANGIVPRQLDGLDGIGWAPLLHAGWGHLVANTVPLLVLGWLAMSGGFKQFLAVTATVWVVGGLGTWLFGSPGLHLGASGLVFGWMVFLLVRGFFVRSLGQILVAAALFLYWGGMLWGVLPGQPGVSWEGHLFGALGGLLAAWLVARVNSRRYSTGAAGTLAE